MDLNKIVNFIYQKFDKFESDRDEKGKIINELQKNVNDISATIEFLKGSLDRQEQYSWKNCLLIHGLPELKNDHMDELKIVIQSRRRWEKKSKRMK